MGRDFWHALWREVLRDFGAPGFGDSQEFGLLRAAEALVLRLRVGEKLALLSCPSDIIPA